MRFLAVFVLFSSINSYKDICCQFNIIKAREINMSDLLIRNESIQLLFNWYQNGKFFVNRKYQRKLVWTLEEKQNFINSIAHSYPIPLFLLAELEKNSDSCYEIIDGMQRLEAIFSFLSGEYSVELGDDIGYFDLATMAETKALLDIGELKQRRPVLSRNACVAIANYPMPLSITRFGDDEIEEIFRRINATGRQLSSQDLRQAGATGAFSNIVRKISNEIRRDTSPSDILPLSKMREISLASSDLSYGIDLRKVFWVQQQIITVKNMRLSRDEELISYLLIYILLGPTVSPTARNLDIIYGFEEDTDLLVNKIMNAIEREGEKNIVTRFMSIFDEFEKMLHKSQVSFSKLIFNNEAHGKGRSFQVIFLAFYNILTSGKELNDTDKLIRILSGIGEREFKDISSDAWKAAYRDEKIRAIEGIISECFIDTSEQNPAIDNWISKLENLLMQSKIEQPLFDLKIGLHSLQNDQYNEDCLHKIIKTLTAMANTGKNTTGYVIVGVADKESDSQKYERKYGIPAKQFNSFYITGVDGEIDKNYKSADEYFNKVKQAVEKEPVDDYTISYITRYMRLVNYYDKSILVLSLKSSDQPLLYDNKIYERRAANVHEIMEDKEVLPNDMIGLFERFK